MGMVRIFMAGYEGLLELYRLKVEEVGPVF